MRDLEMDKWHLTNLAKRVDRAAVRGTGTHIKPQEVQPLYFLLEAGSDFATEEKPTDRQPSEV